MSVLNWAWCADDMTSKQAGIDSCVVPFFRQAFPVYDTLDTRLHRAGVSKELTGLPSLDLSGAVGRSLLVQSFLRQPKEANGIFLSKHVHVREI